MNTRQARLIIAAISSGVLAALVLRRRAALIQTLPELVEERIVLPIGGFMRDGMAARTQEESSSDSGRMTRKVGRNRKISVGGKLYGPLTAELVGAQVEVEDRGEQLVVFAEGSEIASFDRQS